MDYAGRVEQAVTQMMFNDGCSESDISFNHTSGDGYAHSPVAPDKCKVFHYDGGGLSYNQPDSKWLDSAQSAQSEYGEWYFPDSTCVQDIGRGDSGCNTDGTTISEDLLIVLPWVDSNVCDQINRELGLGSPADSGNPWDPSFTKYTGSFTNQEKINSGLAGKSSGCFTSGGLTGNHFYHVIIAR
jgi:hypothetical protein